MEIVTDYTSLYGPTEIPQVTGILGGFMLFFGIMCFISLAISVVVMIAQWKIFVKNSKPGWYAIVPILNVWTLFEIVGIKGWWSLVPGANVVFMYIANYKLPLQMGKSKTLAILNIFFPFVVYPIIAFGKDKTAPVGGLYQQPTYSQPITNQTPMQSQYSQSMANQVPVQPQYNQPMANQTPMQSQYSQPMANQVPVQPQYNQPSPVQPVNPVAQQPVASKRCQNCNTELAPNAAFCPGCGSKQG